MSSTDEEPTAYDVVTEMDERGKVTTTHVPVWPQTSERDEHLKPYYDAGRGFTMSEPLEACLKTSGHGLTAEQEIRALALEHAAYGMGVNVDIRDYANLPGHVLPVAEQYAAWIERGPDETPELATLAEALRRAETAEGDAEGMRVQLARTLTPEAASELRRMYHEAVQQRDELRNEVALHVDNGQELQRRVDEAVAYIAVRFNSDLYGGPLLAILGGEAGGQEGAQPTQDGSEDQK